MTGARSAERRLHADADRLLRRIARRSEGWLVLLGSASLAGAIAQVLLPAAVGHTLDAMLAAARPGAPGAADGVTARWLVGCAALVAVIVLAAAAVELVTGTAGAAATAWLRLVLARRVLDCGPELLQRFNVGDTVGRIVGSAAEAGAAPAGAVLAATAIITPAGSVLALGLIDPWLMVAFTAGFATLAVAMRALVRDSSTASAAYQQAQGEIAARLVDALAGARTIVAAGTRDEEQRRILAPLARLRGQGAVGWRIQARAASRAAVIGPMLQVVVLAVAGIQLARHRITPGELVAASQYALLAVGVGASMGPLGRLGRARGGARRAAEILAQAPPCYGTGILGDGPGQLSFRQVTVRYDNEPVLSGLDLTVPGGAAVAVVGRSGAGKSTLAGLAGRLIDPDEGEVTLDGIALRRLRPQALREAIVYAFERPELFGETAFEAIGFGAWAPAAEQVQAATEDSQAAVFLARLPSGIHTPLEEAPMSGGEVQRLGLARAFAHASRARLLILDDATSSLDTATEMLVSQALTGQLRDHTRLIVAHRAGTAARADLVAWLDEGRLRALSTHESLWADPDYRAAFGADSDLSC